MRDDVQIIIPALNEPYLSTLLHQLRHYAVDVRSELGLSYAVWCGIQATTKKIVVVMDGDGSHIPQVIPKMLHKLNNRVWLVIGSRYCSGGYSSDSRLRQLISRLYCFLTQIMLRTKIRDAMSGFWCGYRHAFNFQPTKDYKFGLQLIRQHKEHIVEHPIFFRKRRKGHSHVKPLQALRDLLSIFFSLTQRDQSEQP